MWALDLGTTNSQLARWDALGRKPSLLRLPSVARRSTGGDPLEAPGVVPSALHVLDEPSLLARLGRSRLLDGNIGLGRLAHIGRPAVELNTLRPRPNYVPSFKRALSMSPLLTVARAGGRAYSAREATRLYLRELLAEAKRATGERIRDLVVTVPVEAFETYRAEIGALATSLGIQRLRFLDEPVAAALGYGLGLSGERHVLVADFGGGTFHVALVRFSAGNAREGRCAVLAKAGRDLGGNLVDAWLLEEMCARLGVVLPEESGADDLSWRRLLLADACRVKESLYFRDSATFEPQLPDDRRRFEARLRGQPLHVDCTRSELVQLLEARGLYRELEACTSEVLAKAAAAGVPTERIDDVLLVGGSTLLPGIYSAFEQRFGRGRVRAWQPFEAIAAGGAVFAGGELEPADFIVHDYALVTFDQKSGDQQHTIIVPAGTRFPTLADSWKRRFVPTCALGEPERTFKLVICEIGRPNAERTYAWDADGRLHHGGHPGRNPIVVQLNQSNPALGTLDPPHSPRDTRPRLEISFGVNADRWLCATVHDLLTNRPLMRNEPVVRLL